MIWIYLLLISVLILGIFGIFGTLFSFFIYKTQKERKLASNLFKVEVEPDEDIVINKFEIKPIEDRLNLLNYRQILKGEDVQLKINLISMLSFNPIRENVLLIKEALFDKNEMIRILASNSLQKMDDYYVNEITKLENKLKKDKSAKNYFELAKIYDEYIYSTLLPEDIVDFYTEKMLNYFEKAYNFSNKDKEISEKYIRACIRFNRLKKAEELIETHLKLYPESISVRFWKFDLLLKKGKFIEIKNMIREIDPDDVKKIPKLYKSYRWWILDE